MVLNQKKGMTKILYKKTWIPKEEKAIDQSVAEIFLDFSNLPEYEARVLTIPTGRDDISRVVVGIQLSDKLDGYGPRTLMYDPVAEELHQFNYAHVDIKDIRRRFREGGLGGVIHSMTEEKLVSKCISRNHKKRNDRHWHPNAVIDRANEWYHYSGSAKDVLEELQQMIG